MTKKDFLHDLAQPLMIIQYANEQIAKNQEDTKQTNRISQALVTIQNLVEKFKL